MKKSIIAIILTMIASMIAIYIFIINISNKSYKNLNSDFKSSNLSQSLYFHQNDYGVFLVNFENQFEIFDLYYSIGYLQAKDRLWQMDYLRKKSEGKLSEIFGEKFVENDKFLRKFDFELKAKQIYYNLNNENKKIIQSYTSGVNDFLKYNNKNLTFEFGFLVYKPIIWTEIDCLKIYLLQLIQNNQEKDNLIKNNLVDNFVLLKNDTLNNNVLNYNILNNYESKNYFQYIQQLKSNLDRCNLSSNYSSYFENRISKKQFDTIKKISNSITETKNKNKLINQKKDTKNNKATNLLINGKTNIKDIDINLINSLEYYSYIKYSNVDLPNENYPLLIKNKKNKLIFINTLVGTPNINLLNSIENVKNFNTTLFDNNYENEDVNNNLKVDFWGFCLTNENDNYILNNNLDNKDNKLQKIIYEIDTLKVKNTSNIQFYKKYIVSNKNKYCLLDDDTNNVNIKNKTKKTYKIQYYWNESDFNFINNYYSKIFQFINNEFTNEIKNPIRDQQLEEKKFNEIISIDYDSLLKVNKFTIKNLNYLDLRNKEKFINNFDLYLKSATLNYNFLNLTNPQISDIILVQIDKNLYFDNYVFSSITNIVGAPKKYLSKKEFDFLYVISKNLKNGKNNINKFVFEFKKELILEFASESSQNKIMFNNNNYIDFMTLNLIYYLKNNKVHDNASINTINNLIINQNEFDLNNYKFRIAKILLRLLKKYNNKDYFNKNYTKLNHKMNFDSKNNVFKSDKIELFGNYNSINYINENKNNNYLFAQSQRYIYDFKNNEIYFILAGGMSGDIFSPNFLDQKILWEKGGYIKLSLLYSDQLKKQFVKKFKINSF